MFRLGRPVGTGKGTVRDQLEQVERQTGDRPPELDMPPIPDCIAHVWEWWVDIASSRGSTGFGPAAITYSEIAAWAALTGADPTPFEVQALRAIERAYLDVQAEIAAQETRK
ncbi:MAG: hypothetical protein ACK53W_12605 [Gemmatimonadota bacterium]